MPLNRATPLIRTYRDHATDVSVSGIDFDERSYVEKKARIQAALEREGIRPKGWREDPSEGPVAVLGKYEVIVDDENCGLYKGDVGQLTACVVGAPEYHNERVSFTFLPDDYADDSMGGNEVTDLSTVEAV